MTILSDLGGVVVEKGFWKLWDFLESEFRIESREARTVFLRYYKDLFGGYMSYELFWENFEKELDLSKGLEFWHAKLVELFTRDSEVLRTYDSFREKGHKIALLTDQVMELWQDIDKRYSVSSHFDYVIISSETGHVKPDPVIYIRALERCDSDPKESIFVDDRKENLVPARELGTKTILFETSPQLRNDLSKLLE